MVALMDERIPRPGSTRGRATSHAGGAGMTMLDRFSGIGGFPCQDLSVAGSRAGLAGKHSGLGRPTRPPLASFRTFVPAWS